MYPVAVVRVVKLEIRAIDFTVHTLCYARYYVDK